MAGCNRFLELEKTGESRLAALPGPSSMPPPPPMEGQRSIMTFFQKAVPATAAVLGSGSAALDASSDASAAATPPSAPPKSGPSALRTKDPLRSSKPERGGTPPAGDPDSEDNVPLRKAPAGLTGSAAPKPANAAGRRDIQTAKGKRKVGPAANNTGGRPTRASKQRAQESLKEKDYSSEELMEKSEEEDGEEGEPGVMTVREKAPVVERPVANTPGVASSSASARSGRRVRFTIEGEGDSFGGQDSPMLEGAFGGQESPIALDDDEVMCFGDALDTDKQETRREARKVAALKIVEGELAPLAFGTPSEETGGERRIVTSGGKRRRSPPRLEKPRLDGTPKPRGTTVAATKKTGRRASESAGSESAGFKDAHTRRSSRGSEKRGGDEGQGKNADLGEVKGNVFERMKVWKKKEEKKEEAAWEHAIVAMEEKIQNGDDGDVDIEEAEAALKEIGEEEEGQAGEHEEQDGEESEEEMSAYERERLANIKRNNAFLLNLGIDQVQVSETPKPKPGAKKPKRREQSPTTPSSAVRRSTRASSGDAQLKGKMLELESLEEQLAAYRHAGETEDETEELLVQQITQLKEDVARLETENAAKRAKLLEENESARKQGLLGADEVEEEEELHYDDSSVKRYDCEAVRLRVSHADLSNGVSGLAEIEDAAYVDSNLKRIYSISFRPCGKLVAAAGHGGMAGIFGIGNTAGGDGEDVLLSWKAHNGWIGDIQFVSHQKDNQASNLVLSASNDKTVVLWDINTATQKKGGKVVPKNLASGAWHGQGVFSLHEVAGCICTGSKDGSVTHSLCPSLPSLPPSLPITPSPRPPMNIHACSYR